MKMRRGPDGIHLFDRRTGTNVLFDEIHVPPEAWSPAPRQVSVALTNACDLDCPFCYAPKQPASLDLDRLTGWLRELDEAGGLGVGFGGGEPTLYRKLPELCHYVSDVTGLAVSLTTHAHHWTLDLARALSGAVHFVRVSVDGTGDIYERIRGRSYPELCDRLSLISGEFPIGINCVVNETTVHDLDAVAELAMSSGAVELLLLPQRPARGCPAAGDWVLAIMKRWVESHTAAGGPLRVTLPIGEARGLPVADPLPAEIGLRSYAHVDATGTLRATSYSEAGVAIGSGGFMTALAELEEMDRR